MSEASLLVYCDDESHPTKVADVGVLMRSDESSLWYAAKRRPFSASDFADMRPAPIVDGAYRSEYREVLYDDAAVTQLLPSDDGIPDWKYRLACPLCGLDVQRGAAAAKPVLDQLASAGVSRIKLAALRRLLLA